MFRTKSTNNNNNNKKYVCCFHLRNRKAKRELKVERREKTQNSLSTKGLYFTELSRLRSSVEKQKLFNKPGIIYYGN